MVWAYFCVKGIWIVVELEDSFHFLTRLMQKFISCCAHVTLRLLAFIHATEIGEAEKVDVVYLQVQVS